ncbi:MAG: hypothetical protein NT013_10055 [Planctomycetia bacterium]|nr:hypothetical protein [Planctomycetia bacterium]
MSPPAEPFVDRNTNPKAYTVGGGRRDDDPVPPVLPPEAYARDAIVSVTVEVTGINHVDNAEYCAQRLMEIAPPRGNQATNSHLTTTRVMIGGVSDLNAFAKLIDFGEVTKIDDYLRIIYVKARDDRMPQILPKVSTKPDDPHFYRDNLASLTHWHPTLRLNAIKELKKHLPEDAQLREKILQAIAIRATDVDRNVVMAATSDGETVSSSNVASKSGFSFSFGNSVAQPEKLPARKQPEIPLVETTVAGVVLEPKEILDGKVKLLIPKEFSVMSADMLEVKYPDAQRPTLVFTNEKGTVNLAFNHTKNKATAAAIPVFHRQTEAMMRRQIAAENWLASEMITLDELNWFRLDFRTPAVDTTIRNITLGTSLENRILLVSFNTTTAEEEAWLPIGQQMIQSLRISR